MRRAKVRLALALLAVLGLVIAFPGFPGYLVPAALAGWFLVSVHDEAIQGG